MKDTTAGDIQVNPCRLAFVARFESREETRYYLNGTYVAPHPDGGVVMVATDGHTLGIGHDPDGHCSEPVILETRGTGHLFKPPAKVRDICRLVLTKAPGRPHTFMAERFAVSVSGQPLPQSAGRALGMVKAIDGTFPDWKRAVPWKLAQEGAEGFKGNFNGSYVAKFCQQFAPGEPARVDLRQEGPGDPAAVLLHDVPWFLGVIMPMRTDYRPAEALLALAPKEEPAKKGKAKEPA